MSSGLTPSLAPSGAAGPRCGRSGRCCTGRPTGWTRQPWRSPSSCSEMVDVSVAGVMFTANPITGDRSETVIDASPGLGEAVVSGAVNPDHFVVLASSGEIVEQRLGSGQCSSVPGPAAGPNGWSNRPRTVPAWMPDRSARWRSWAHARRTALRAPQDAGMGHRAGGALWLTQIEADHHALPGAGAGPWPAPGPGCICVSAWPRA